MSEPESKLDLTALQDALDDQSKNRSPTAASAGLGSKLSKPEDGNPSPETLSPSSPGSRSPAPRAPQPTVTSVAPSEQRRQDAPPPDPQVEQIRSMFPDFDQDTVAAVLEAQGGNLERAVNALLSMSDPSYKPPPPASNEEADAALARSLAQQQRAEYITSQPQPQRPFHQGTGAVYDPSQLNYQPRLRRNPPSQSGAQAYHAPPPTGFENINRDQAPIGWPGPDDARRWGDQINSAAEKGFAQASTAFSALRQRLAQGTSPGGTPTGGSAMPSGRGGGGAASFFNSFGGTASANASASGGDRNARGNVKSPDQKYDRDAAQVGDADLAALLASNGAPKPPSKADRMLGDTAKSGSFDQRYGSNVGSAAGKLPNRHSVGRQVRPEDEADDDEEELGWESAGRAPAPISIRDNSRVTPGAPSTPLREGKSSTGSNRDAVDRMEASTGRGLTSPKPKSPAAAPIGAAAAGATAAGTAAADGDEQTKSKARSDDGSSDGEDLEYVSNPFDDED